MALATKTLLYKAFIQGEDGGLRTKYGSQDLTYEVGETYTVEGNLKMCKNGYHACQNPFECLGYYRDSPGCVMAEISVDKVDGVFIVSGSQACFRSYTINRIIPREEWQSGTYTSLDGTQRWYKDGVLHRDDDEPAVIYPSGTYEWHKDGKLHRDGDEPALIFAGGTRKWYKNGKLHRDDGKPAVAKRNGTQYWYKDGKLHRDGDEPALIFAGGTRKWYKNGKVHRNGDKPAVIKTNGTCQWFKEGSVIEK